MKPASVVGSPGIELSGGDPAFAGRVRRLVGVSTVALGAITLLANRDGAAGGVIALLALGWVLMPPLLLASLWRPRLRYALILPATLVGGALAWFLLGGLPTALTVRVGWILVAGGVWLGGVLGAWLWCRWLPVPAGLESPFAPARWALIAVHAGSVTVGLVLVLVR